MSEQTAEPVTINERDFMCRCDDKQAARCDAVMEEVLERLGGGSDELAARKVTRETLLTAVVYSLWWDHTAEITGITCDQWCAVSAVGYRWDDEAPNKKTGGKGSLVETVRTWVQCDQVEDGVAATWKFFADRAPEGREADD